MTRRAVPQVPSPLLARADWKALGRQKRRAVIRAARHGEAWPERQTAFIALGWAWAILGPPQHRRNVGVLEQSFDVVVAVVSGGGVVAAGDPFSADPTHDANPFVRRAARAVERANQTVLIR